jgi:hypothetical protein
MGPPISESRRAACAAHAAMMADHSEHIEFLNRYSGLRVASM